MRHPTKTGLKVRALFSQGLGAAEIVTRLHPKLTGQEREKKVASVRTTLGRLKSAEREEKKAARIAAEPHEERSHGELIQLATPPRATKPAPASPPPKTDRVNCSREEYLERTIRQLHDNADDSTGDQTTKALREAAALHKELDKLRADKAKQEVVDAAQAEARLIASMPSQPDSVLDAALAEIQRRNPSLIIQVA